MNGWQLTLFIAWLTKKKFRILSDFRPNVENLTDTGQLWTFFSPAGDGQWFLNAEFYFGGIVYFEKIWSGKNQWKFTGLNFDQKIDSPHLNPFWPPNALFTSIYHQVIKHSRTWNVLTNQTVYWYINSTKIINGMFAARRKTKSQGRLTLTSSYIFFEFGKGVIRFCLRLLSLSSASSLTYKRTGKDTNSCEFMSAWDLSCLTNWCGSFGFSIFIILFFKWIFT